jgi:hypothetical protein
MITWLASDGATIELGNISLGIAVVSGEPVLYGTNPGVCGGVPHIARWIR